MGIASIHLENKSTSSKNTLPKNGLANQGVFKSKDVTPSPNHRWCFLRHIFILLTGRAVCYYGFNRLVKICPPYLASDQSFHFNDTWMC